MLPSVTTYSTFAKSVMMLVLSQKWEFFVQPEVKKVNVQYVLVTYLTVATNVSCYQTGYRRQYCYYVPFSNTAHARNAVQQMRRNTLNFLSPEMWLQQARAKLIIDNNIQGVYSSVNMCCRSTKLMN